MDDFVYIFLPHLFTFLSLCVFLIYIFIIVVPAQKSIFINRTEVKRSGGYWSVVEV